MKLNRVITWGGRETQAEGGNCLIRHDELHKTRVGQVNLWLKDNGWQGKPGESKKTPQKTKPHMKNINTHPKQCSKETQTHVESMNKTKTHKQKILYEKTTNPKFSTLQNITEIHGNSLWHRVFCILYVICGWFRSRTVVSQSQNWLFDSGASRHIFGQDTAPKCSWWARSTLCDLFVSEDMFWRPCEVTLS